MAIQCGAVAQTEPTASHWCEGDDAERGKDRWGDGIKQGEDRWGDDVERGEDRYGDLAQSEAGANAK
jgi:hypothetical protein